MQQKVDFNYWAVRKFRLQNERKFFLKVVFNFLKNSFQMFIFRNFNQMQNISSNVKTDFLKKRRFDML